MNHMRKSLEFVVLGYLREGFQLVLEGFARSGIYELARASAVS